jgi:hypothetical protein
MSPKSAQNPSPKSHGLTLGLAPEMVRKPSKSRMPALARGIICHLAIFEFGYSGSEVGKYLYLGSSGVSLAAKRGEKFLNADAVIMKQIMDAIEK